jgi:hypothetical protein
VFNGTSSNLYEGSYNQLPGSVFDVLQMVNNESESMLGIKAFSGGINGNGLGNTAAAANGALDAVAVRRLDIVRNLAETLIKPLLRKWSAYNAEFLQEEEVVRITDDDFVEIKRDDLAGQVDISLEISTAEVNSHKSQRISFLLQTLGQSLPQDMLYKMMAQIAKLERMPDLAKMLEEYQPQPDPYVEEMKELEKEKLISEIRERLSRSDENKVDVQVKAAKARLDQAKAENIISDTDLKDLDFTRRAEGEEFAEKMSEKEHERNSALMQNANKQP